MGTVLPQLRWVARKHYTIRSALTDIRVITTTNIHNSRTAVPFMWGFLPPPQLYIKIYCSLFADDVHKAAPGDGSKRVSFRQESPFLNEPSSQPLIAPTGEFLVGFSGRAIVHNA